MWSRQATQTRLLAEVQYFSDADGAKYQRSADGRKCCDKLSVTGVIMVHFKHAVLWRSVGNSTEDAWKWQSNAKEKWFVVLIFLKSVVCIDTL